MLVAEPPQSQKHDQSTDHGATLDLAAETIIRLEYPTVKAEFYRRAQAQLGCRVVVVAATGLEYQAVGLVLVASRRVILPFVLVNTLYPITKNASRAMFSSLRYQAFSAH